MEIKNLDNCQLVTGQYIIVENQLRTAKNGSEYLALKIADQTGELQVKIWGADEELFRLMEVGRVIELNNIRPKMYKDQIQLDWDAKNKECYQLIPESEVDYSKFLPKAPGDIAGYWKSLTSVMEGIKNPSLRKVLKTFFDDPSFIAEFLRVPAALKRHHAYIGGLLEHTAGVTSLCCAAADYYPDINRDLLLAGAILHDIGKVRTYKLEKGIEGSDEGRLIGHLVLGVEMVETAIRNALSSAEDGDVKEIRQQLLHLLVSHHGIMEWGSPVEPLTIEATILHHADNMDAQITKFLTIIRADRSGNNWSAYDPGLGRSIYLGGQEKVSKKELEEGA